MRWKLSSHPGLSSNGIGKFLPRRHPFLLTTLIGSVAELGPPNIRRVDLPSLSIPRSADYIDAALYGPQRVQLLKPFEVSLVVTNTHATAAAPAVTVQLASDDNFVWEGPRHIKLPLLLPGGQWSLPLSMTALAQTGWQALPSVHIADGPGDSQREIAVHSTKASETERGQDILVYVQPG